jgi:outer membrane protein OmpA-like peptidoglycan-associated protein
MLGAIDNPVPASKVKAAALIAKLESEYKDSRDLSQPSFRPGSAFGGAEAKDGEILARSVYITFKPNEYVFDTNYDNRIPQIVEEIGKLSGAFGNAYVVVEGNTDASKKGLVPADLVRELSFNRANAVKQALIDKYGFNPNKFKVVGNGWDNPVAGMTDPSNAEHNKRNRRVEIKVFPLEGE